MTLVGMTISQDPGPWAPLLWRKIIKILSIQAQTLLLYLIGFSRHLLISGLVVGIVLTWRLPPRTQQLGSMSSITLPVNRNGAWVSYLPGPTKAVGYGVGEIRQSPSLRCCYRKWHCDAPENMPYPPKKSKTHLPWLKKEYRINPDWCVDLFALT